MPRLMVPPRSRVTIQDPQPFWWLRWVPSLVFAGLVLYFVYVVGRVAIVPVLASLAIAYVISPIAEGFENSGASRAMAALAAIVLVFLLIAGFLGFVIPDLWENSAKASEVVVRNLNEVNAREARSILQEFSPLLDRVIGWRVYKFLQSPDALMEASQSWFAGRLTGFLTTAAGVFDLALIPFFVFYILVDFRRWRRSFDDLIPPRFREPFSRLFDEVGRILQSYVLGQLMIAMIMAGLYAVGFALLQVPAWAGLAALSGFLNVVPYVGTALGLIFASGFSFAVDQDIWRVAGVIGVFSVVQAIEGYVLTPRILGERLSLHPMAVFLGLLIGGRLFGFLGFLLAVPVIAVSQVFVRFLREIYKTSEFYRSGQMGPEPPPMAMEDIIAQAAESVLAAQVAKQEGNELLVPDRATDDPAALRKR